jgi:hypothetical protein
LMMSTASMDSFPPRTRGAPGRSLRLGVNDGGKFLRMALARALRAARARHSDSECGESSRAFSPCLRGRKVAKKPLRLGVNDGGKILRMALARASWAKQKWKTVDGLFSAPPVEPPHFPSETGNWSRCGGLTRRGYHPVRFTPRESVRRKSPDGVGAFFNPSVAPTGLTSRYLLFLSGFGTPPL